jgi:hypothetical protein
MEASGVFWVLKGIRDLVCGGGGGGGGVGWGGVVGGGGSVWFGLYVVKSSIIPKA